MELEENKEKFNKYWVKEEEKEDRGKAHNSIFHWKFRKAFIPLQDRGSRVRLHNRGNLRASTEISFLDELSMLFFISLH